MAKLFAKRRPLPAIRTPVEPGRMYPQPDEALGRSLATRIAPPVTRASGLRVALSSHPNAARLGPYLHPARFKK